MIGGGAESPEGGAAPCCFCGAVKRKKENEDESDPEFCRTAAGIRYPSLRAAHRSLLLAVWTAESSYCGDDLSGVGSGFSDAVRENFGSFWMPVYLLIAVLLTFLLAWPPFGVPLRRIKHMQMKVWEKLRPTGR